MATSYKFLHSGDWVAFEPTMLKLACCDCGLVHNFDLQFRKGKLGFIIRPDRRATGQIRKQRDITIRKKE